MVLPICQLSACTLTQGNQVQHDEYQTRQVHVSLEGRRDAKCFETACVAFFSAKDLWNNDGLGGSLGNPILGNAP